ncbi:MAG: methyltransferase domain-containing protein [Theionarchaea archaeon]|nr:methyltransferase domain-containing protein [Theionarchaea archaeon]
MDVEGFYDERAPFYDGEYRTPFFDLYRALTWDNISRFLPAEGVILDAGGGTGEWAIPLAEAGFDVVLVDISRGMLRQARRKLEEKNIRNVTVERVDMTDMSSFQDNMFDMVLVQGDPLSYCGNAEKAVAEIYRVLKEGRHCIASVDCMYEFILRLITLKQWDVLKTLFETERATFQTGFEIRYFTPGSLRQLFEGAGFEVVRILGKPVFLSRVPRERAHDLLRDKKVFDRILELELQFCDNPNLIGFAGHLEIAGKKV